MLDDHRLCNQSVILKKTGRNINEENNVGAHMVLYSLSPIIIFFIKSEKNYIAITFNKT